MERKWNSSWSKANHVICQTWQPNMKCDCLFFFSTQQSMLLNLKAESPKNKQQLETAALPVYVDTTLTPYTIFMDFISVIRMPITTYRLRHLHVVNDIYIKKRYAVCTCLLQGADYICSSWSIHYAGALGIKGVYHICLSYIKCLNTSISDQSPWGLAPSVWQGRGCPPEVSHRVRNLCCNKLIQDFILPWS